MASRPAIARIVALVAFAYLLVAANGYAAKPKPASNPMPAAMPADAIPPENPLRRADEATKATARHGAWTTFERDCRPCHGNLGAGDGPYFATFATHAADLRRPSRDVVPDAVRFKRIRDGAAVLSDRPWDSSMPAFGDSLDTQQIWGLVSLLEDLGKEASGIDSDATAADVYAERCAVCHGTKGAGDGPLAPELFPPPRDFVHAAYRFRSTKSGAAPLDTDIIGVSAHGLGDTAMGRFLSLGAERLEDVAHYVQSFAPAAFATEPPTLESNEMPAEPMAQMAARGLEVYARAKCGDCHGPTGRGDGPSAPTLKDDAGHPSVATNLTKRWLYKVGAGATDVFRTLASGLNGTPMESFDPALSTADRWALAAYLEHIARTRPRYVPTVQTILVTEKLPDDPTAPFWKTIPAAFVPLGPQVEVPPYWTQPSIDTVEIVAAANADELGVLLVWDDPTRNVDSQDAQPTTVASALARRGSWRLPDAVAVQTLTAVDPKGTRPPLYLGNASHPVERWLWSADRQEHGETAASVQRIAGPTAAPAAVDGVVVHATGRYVDGQWRVLLRTKRPPKTVAVMPFAVHAWDGAAAEAGHWHGLSGWMNLSLR